MGIFDLLSKEGRAKSALDGATKKTLNKFVQSIDREAAMEKLREIGTDEALFGLCRRFGMLYDKTIDDEREKQWVQDTLIGLGERAIGPVKRWLLQGETISQALTVLAGVAQPDKVLEVVDELIEREEPGYARHPDKKIQMLSWLGEWKGAVAPAEVTKRIVPYLKDFDETVRFTAVEALAHVRPHEESSRLPLFEALLRPEEESRRILVRVAEVLAERGWAANEEHGARLTEVAAKLPEFTLDKDRRLSKKAR